MKSITKETAKQLIKESKGRIFAATFIKKDNTIRTLTGRLEVSKHLKKDAKKQPFKPSEYGLQCVYDMKSKGYRMINLNTLTNLSINNIKYIIK